MQHADISNSIGNECRFQPSEISLFEPLSEKRSEIKTDRQDFKVEFSSESSHVFESKEVELSVAAVHSRELSSSYVRNKDSITNVSGKPLSQAHGSFSADDKSHENESVTSNFSHGIPLIEVSDEPRKQSLDEEALRQFMEEMKLSFQNAPSAIENIDIEDLKPPDFYRSVSRSSMDQEVEDLNMTAATSDYLTETSGGDLGGHRSLLAHVKDEKNKTPSESHSRERDTNQKQDTERTEEGESFVSQAEPQLEDSTKDAANAQPEEEEEKEEEDDEERGSGYARQPRLSFQNCMVFTRGCAFPTNESPSPPLSSPSSSTNPPTPSAGPAAIYTAEVKVVQRSSLPTTPAPDGESRTSPYTECCPQIHKVACPLFLQVGGIPCARMHATRGPLMKYKPELFL